MLGQKTLSFTLFNERNWSRNVTAKIIAVRELPCNGIIGLDVLMKYGATINLAKGKLTLCDEKRRAEHTLFKDSIECCDCQLIVTD